MSARRHSEVFSDGRRSDQRQLFALDVRPDVDAPLVFMPEGGADRLRERTRAGDLICPVPGCADPAYVARGGTMRRHHFAHRPGAGGHAPESYFHLVAKRLLADWVRRCHPQMQVALEQQVESGQIADVLITSPRTGARVALEIQFSPLNEDEWVRRSAGYAGHSVRVQWIFGHLPPHLRRVRNDGGYKMGALHQAALRDDIPVLFINPDRGLIARMVDGSLWAALDNAGEAAGLPRPEFDAARLLVHHLDDCRLGPEGLRTPDAAMIDQALVKEHKRKAQAQREWEREHAAQAQRQRRYEQRVAQRRTRTAIDPPKRSTLIRQEMARQYQLERPVLMTGDGMPPGPVLARSKSDERIWMDPTHWKHALWVKWRTSGSNVIERRTVFAQAAELNRAAPGAIDADHRAIWAWEALAWWLWELRKCRIVAFDGLMGEDTPVVQSDLVITIPRPTARHLYPPVQRQERSTLVSVPANASGALPSERIGTATWEAGVGFDRPVELVRAGHECDLVFVRANDPTHRVARCEVRIHSADGMLLSSLGVFHGARPADLTRRRWLPQVPGPAMISVSQILLGIDGRGRLLTRALRVVVEP